MLACCFMCMLSNKKNYNILFYYLLVYVHCLISYQILPLLINPTGKYLSTIINIANNW